MIELISSPQNKLIKMIASLKQKKYRDELGLFPAEGVRLAEEAVHSGWEIALCLCTDEAMQQPRVEAIVQKLKISGSRVLQTTTAIFAKASDTEQPQGIIVIARKKLWKLEDMFAGKEKPLLLILNRLQDPGNVGAAIRTADAAGCTGVVLTKGCADLYAGKTVRATMGSLFHLPVIDSITDERITECMRDNGILMLATSLEASAVYTVFDYDRPVAVVFGNEGAGVGPELLNNAAASIHIPIYGQAESLNVSASVAVILYEAVRQRRQS